MKPAFVLLASFVATLLSSSCNTDEQEKPFVLDVASMSTEFVYMEDGQVFYSRTITDSTYTIEDSTGVLAERFKDGSWNIQNTWLALEATYKIDSMISSMYNKDTIQ